MRTLLAFFCLIVGTASAASAAKIQGLLVAQDCAQDIVKNGREATLKQKPACSLRTHYIRSNYALITDDKRYFTFDQFGNQKALQLLGGTSNRDNLKVVVTGDISGNTIKVKYMSIL